MNNKISRRTILQTLGMTVPFVAHPLKSLAKDNKSPNIVWILAEDASPHIGCYGETAIKTPHLDALAGNGVRFDSAFVTCPVCSPCRSAMVTGIYQPTLGAHNHRSQSDSGKAGGNKDYYGSYKLPVKLIPELFHDAGYYITLGNGPTCQKMGKTDYNFIWPKSAYDASNWQSCPDNKPFFAQIMLHGGKNRSAKHGVNPADVKLPPYYPDTPTMREDWATYLNSWIQIDHEVGQIMENLKNSNVLDNTIVFFWTDHGISHIRGKQFLYDEGIQVPLIVRFPDKKHAGTTRHDPVIQTDIAAASLALAGISIPRHIQGENIFDAHHNPRKMIVSARDRCDETVDIIRCIRTPKFKYIRNFLSHLPHAQPNQYKDGKAISKNMRQLNKEGKLTPLQSRIFQPQRPTEELYDIKNDPNEINNLAQKSEYQATLKQMRHELYQWMIQNNDLGLIPEPILEDMGKQYGNKYFVLQKHPDKNLARKLIKIIAAADQGNTNALNIALKSKEPAIRYWAATGLGRLEVASAIASLSKATNDSSAAVRIAASLALCKLGQADQHIPSIIKEINNSNLIAGMYAIRALELSAIDTPEVRNAVEKARKSPYEFTRRIANRMSTKFNS
jgi:arylsulfatase A-like enzyme